MRRLLAGLAAAALLVACTDGFFFEPTDPSGGFSITFDLSVASQYTTASLGSTFDKVDRARIVLRNSADEVVVDESVDFDPANPTVEVDLDFDIPAEGGTYGLTGELYVGPDLIYSGSTTVVISPTGATTAEIPILPISIEIQAPDTVRFDALRDTVAVPVYGIFANGDSIPSVGIAWTVLDPGVASATAAGTFVSHAQGSTRAIARSGNQVDTTEVVVEPVVTEVAVQPDVVAADVDVQVQFTATAMDRRGNALERSATWSVDDAGVASIDSDGLLVTQGEGTATVSAEVEGVTGTAEITVTREILPVASVTVQPPAGEILVGGTIALTAVARDANGSVLLGRTTEWSSSDAGIARVSTSGVVTGVALGDATVTATVEGISATATISVVEPGVATVTITPAEAEVVIGETQPLTAIVRDADGNILEGRTVEWSSSNTSAATVSADGVVTGVATGSATIEALVEGVSGTAAITVIPVPVETVEVTPAEAEVIVGATQALTATARDADGNVVTGRPVTWSSSDEAVATVSAEGVVTGVAAGTATIEALVDGVQGTATITVIDVPVATVEVTPAEADVVIGQTQALTATARDADGNVLEGRTATWSSSDEAVATVSAEGVVTAVALGTVTIEALVDGVSGTAAITVIEVPVGSVEVTPAAATVLVSETQQLTATVRDGDGNVLEGRTVTWSSDATSVATVDANGLVTAVSGGTAVISATSSGVTGQATITVPTPTPVAGGTWTYVDSDGESIIHGTAFLFDPSNDVDPGAPVSSVTVSGPAGWNSDQDLECVPIEEGSQDVASDRAVCLEFPDAVSGTYTATSDLGSTEFSVDAASHLSRPVIDGVASAGADEITVWWTGDPSHGSYVVAIYDAETGELVVSCVRPGSWDSVVLQATLSPSKDYIVVVTALSEDVTVEGQPFPASFRAAESDSYYHTTPRPQQLFVSGYDDGSLTVFRQPTFSVLGGDSPAAATNLADVVISYSDRVFVSDPGDASGLVHVFSSTTYQWAGSIDLPSPVERLVGNDLYDEVYAGGEDGVIQVMDGANGAVCECFINVGAAVAGLAVSPDGNTLYATTADGVVVFVDLYSLEILATVDVGSGPTGVAATSSYVFAANGVDGTVSVIDVNSHTVVTTIPVGSAPEDVVLAPDPNYVLVANRGSGTVSVIFVPTLAIDDEIPVGSEPVSLAFAPVDNLLYVTNYGGGTVSVISTISHEVLRTIQKAGAWGAAVRYTSGATFSPPATGGPVRAPSRRWSGPRWSPPS